MVYVVIGIAILILDIITKLWAELALVGNFGGALPVWEGVFHLTYVENRGIAFGMLSNVRLISVGLSLAVLVLIAILFAKTTRRTRWLKTGAALIYGGAVGNLIERLAKGYVVDFLDFRLIHFPVFNVADIAVCVGALLLAVHFCLADQKPSDSAKGGQNR